MDLKQLYSSSLQELTFNSKPIITNLTIIAEENIHLAPSIVQAIEEQLLKVFSFPKKVPTNQKLPLMYLMDSILKNVGKDFINCFQTNLINTFTNTFFNVSDADKMRLQVLFSNKETHTYLENTPRRLFVPFAPHIQA